MLSIRNPNCLKARLAEVMHLSAGPLRDDTIAAIWSQARRHPAWARICVDRLAEIVSPGLLAEMQAVADAPTPAPKKPSVQRAERQPSYNDIAEPLTLPTPPRPAPEPTAPFDLTATLLAVLAPLLRDAIRETAAAVGAELRAAFALSQNHSGPPTAPPIGTSCSEQNPNNFRNNSEQLGTTRNTCSDGGVLADSGSLAPGEPPGRGGVGVARASDSGDSNYSPETKESKWVTEVPVNTYPLQPNSALPDSRLTPEQERAIAGLLAQHPPAEQQQLCSEQQPEQPNNEQQQPVVPSTQKAGVAEPGGWTEADLTRQLEAAVVESRQSFSAGHRAMALVRRRMEAMGHDKARIDAAIARAQDATREPVTLATALPAIPPAAAVEVKPAAPPKREPTAEELAEKARRREEWERAVAPIRERQQAEQAAAEAAAAEAAERRRLYPSDDEIAAAMSGPPSAKAACLVNAWNATAGAKRASLQGYGRELVACLEDPDWFAAALDVLRTKFPIKAFSERPDKDASFKWFLEPGTAYRLRDGEYDTPWQAGRKPARRPLTTA